MDSTIPFISSECQYERGFWVVYLYTTRVSVDKTVGEIQKCPASHGAKAILCEYDDKGNVIALNFKVKVGNQDIAFRLPSDWRPVLKLLEHDRKVPRSFRTPEQAMRVSWRIVKDWVEAQMAIVETKINVPVTIRRVPRGFLFWRSTAEDLKQAKETAQR